MSLDDILDFLGDFVYEIVLTIAVFLFMTFYSKILFFITRCKLRNRVDLRIWVTVKLKDNMTGEEFKEYIDGEIQQLQKMPAVDMTTIFNGTRYAFMASDLERKVNSVRTVTYIDGVEVRKIKDELTIFDYNTRKLFSKIRMLDSDYTAEIRITLDKAPNMEFVGMRLSSVKLNESDDQLEIKLDGNALVFKTDFNPACLDAVVDFITFLYTPR